MGHLDRLLKKGYETLEYDSMADFMDLLKGEILIHDLSSSFKPISERIVSAPCIGRKRIVIFVQDEFLGFLGDVGDFQRWYDAFPDKFKDLQLLVIADGFYCFDNLPPHIKYLHIYASNFKYLDFLKNHPDLIYLGLYWCNFDRMHFLSRRTSFPSIKYLVYKDCRISSCFMTFKYDFNIFPNVISLNIRSYHPGYTLKSVIDQFPKLQYLKLYDNDGLELPEEMPYSLKYIETRKEIDYEQKHIRI